MKIITIGSATQDIFIRQLKPAYAVYTKDETKKTYLVMDKGSKADIQPVVTSTGGAATNAAVTFTNFGYKALIYSVIGNDDVGKFIKNDLATRGLETRLITSVDKNSTRSFIFSFPDGDRSILTDRGAQEELSLKTLESELKDTDCLYISGLCHQANKELADICKHAHEQGILVALNPGSYQLHHGFDDLKKAFSFVDVLILNAQEAGNVFEQIGCPKNESGRSMNIAESKKPALLQSFFKNGSHVYTLEDFFRAMRHLGLKKVIVTNGKDGVYLLADSVMYYHPSLTATVANTVGAGDAFGSAFVASLLAKKAVDEALLMALCNSRGVISKLDAKSGLVSKSLLESYVQGIGTSLMYVFSLR